MFKPTTTSLVLLLTALNVYLQGAYATPVPWSFKIPGVKGGTYRSGSGWGDVTELDWKIQADTAAKQAEAAAKAFKNGGSYSGKAVAGAGVAGAVGAAGITGGAMAGSQSMGYDYVN